MPNWSSNTLEIVGKPAEITAVLDFIASKDEMGNIICPFSFNKIIPMPKELDDIGEYAYSPEFYKDPEDFWSETDVSKWHQMRVNKEKYGFYNWKDWSIKNWGSKWPAGMVSASENKVFYITPWAPPTPIIITISKAFPYVGFISRSSIEGGSEEEEYFINGFSIFYQTVNFIGPSLWLEKTGVKMNLMIDGNKGVKNIHDYCL